MKELSLFQQRSSYNNYLISLMTALPATALKAIPAYCYVSSYQR